MNKCGECNVCCKACVIDEIQKPAGTICWLYVDKGCSVYENRPEPCKLYQCVYTTQNSLDTKYRPDNLGVLFEQPLNKQYWVGIELVSGALNTEACARLIRAMNNDGARILLKYLDGKLQHSLPKDASVEAFIEEIKG